MGTPCVCFRIERADSRINIKLRTYHRIARSGNEGTTSLNKHSGAMKQKMKNGDAFTHFLSGQIYASASAAVHRDPGLLASPLTTWNDESRSGTQ